MRTVVFVLGICFLFLGCSMESETEKQATEAAELVKELLFHFHQKDDVFNKIKELLK